MFRTPGVSWWSDEELGSMESFDCYEEYVKVKPSVVVSHDAPNIVTQHLIDPKMGRLHKTSTGSLLNSCLEAHKPLLWIFGHWHKSYDNELDGTRYVCLNELETKTFDL
jgi:Icc-related predicted phosphoesterase